MNKKTYPIVDLPKREIRKKFGFKGIFMRSPTKEIRAVLTGEKRAPKKGEWYLSGAIPAGYTAPNDFSTEYCILKLVLVETAVVETQTIIDVEDSTPEEGTRYYIDGAIVTVLKQQRELPAQIRNRADFIYNLTDHKVIKTRTRNPEIDESKMLDDGIPKRVVWGEDNWTATLEEI